VRLFFLPSFLSFDQLTSNLFLAVTVSYASVVFVGVLLLSSIAWVLYGNRAFLPPVSHRPLLTPVSLSGHYAGPIRTTTRWTIGAEVDLPSSSSQGDAPRKKTTVAVGVTTSAAHGRSAHVFATSDAGGETRTPRATRDGETRETERSGVTSGGTEMTGSEWSEYTGDEDSDGSYTDDEDDEDETDDEVDGASERRRPPNDEETGDAR
jgi:hypothetical protein